jgi:PAS domain S-box-containing protein
MAAKATYDELRQRVKELEKEVRARKRAEKAQQENQNQYSELADLLPQTVFEIDKRGNITFANKHGFESLGYTKKDLNKGLNAGQLFVPGDRNRLRKNIRKVLSGQKSPGNEYTALRKDGSTFPAITYSGAIIREGKPVGLTGILIDITELKQAQETLRQSENKMRALLNATTESVILIDKKGIVLTVNETAAQRLGTTVDELQGVNIYSLLSPKVAKRRKMWVNKLIRSRKAIHFEDERDGRMWSHSVYAVLDKRGRVVQLAIYSTDVTEERRAVAQMKEKRAALKAKKLELQEVNAALRVLLKGRDRDKSELEGKVLSNVKELVAPYIHKLMKSRLDMKQMTYLRILQSNLNDIVSPFVHQLSSKYSALTPKEIQVAQLVREGNTTREIAELSNSSTRTIESHRQSIRIKLGVKDTKANLRSLLSSM